MGKSEYLYKYNDKNLPIEIITPIGTEYITYDKAGRITLKENSQTGTQKKYSYFPDGNIKDILTSQSGETVYFENYSYDKNGNKVYENLNGIVSQYSYDGMSRLKRAIKNNIVTEYEFDGFNNISKEFEIADNKISKKQHFYDLNNRLILSEEQSNVIQYQYDNAGNLTKKSYFTGGKATDSYYRYDGYNRLSEFESNDTYSQYAYNPDGLREYKTVNGVKTRFMYNGADVAGELTDGNYYLYHRATELMGYTSFKGDTYYYRQDSHGNVTAILDITGNEIKSYSYNPYGKKETFSINPEGNNTILYQWKAETDKFHNPFGYCGEYTDNETGLIYLRNRYYDTNNGRFITEDPIKDGLNWYVYCENNPVMFVDPLGLKLVLKGTGDEVQSIWKTIKEFSQDDLLLTQQKDADGNLVDSYIVTVNEERDGGCNVGTELVRRIIYSDENVTVEVGTEGNLYYPRNRTISFNPNSNPDIMTVNPETGNVVPAKRPSFIGLAHEMIHADRHIRGVTGKGNANYKFQISRTKCRWGPFGGYDYTYETENVPKEELATVGLKYNKKSDITENMIRAEHGLNLRGAY